MTSPLIFITYGSPADQITALRVQTLLAASGVTSCIRPVHDGRVTGTHMVNHRGGHINTPVDTCDAMLAIAIGEIGEQMMADLIRAQQLRKSVFEVGKPDTVWAWRQPVSGNDRVYFAMVQIAEGLCGLMRLSK